jgi:hypothetical protein
VTIVLDMELRSFTNCRNGGTGSILLIGFFAVAACGRAGLAPPNPTGLGGSDVETGGVVGPAGTGGLGTGGIGPGSGGRLGTGGVIGSGGWVSVGGAASGGTRASGGVIGSGGSSGTIGSGGMLATGGIKASGGTTSSGASGGIRGSGGVIGTGGIKATGGTVATGGSSAGGSGGDGCSNVIACGGDAVGSWTVTSSCLTISGQLDLSLLGAGCTSAQVTGSLQVAGDWTGKANGTYLDKTTTSGTQQITLPASCLQIAGTTTTCDRIGSAMAILGYDSVSCKSIAGGGCACAASVKQDGWPGLVSPYASTSGKYATSGNTITLDEDGRYSYCVSGSKMTWTPQTTYQSITGTIVFQNTPPH